jgi:Laminin B (Domain IV)/PEP-CTERM motif
MIIKSSNGRISVVPNKLICATALAFALSLTQASAVPTISSTFDSDAQGWTVENDYTLTYHSTGGNPGGYVLGTDAGQGSTGYFVAPSAYLGNKSAYLGATLSYQLDFIPVSGGGSPNTTAITTEDVILTGVGGASVSWTSTVDPSLHPNIWQTYSVVLNSTNFTGGDIATVLGNLTKIEILAEFISGTESEGLDNVSLTPAVVVSGVPEPSTWAMMILGFCGLGFMAYRRKQNGSALSVA